MKETFAAQIDTVQTFVHNFGAFRYFMKMYTIHLLEWKLKNKNFKRTSNIQAFLCHCFILIQFLLFYSAVMYETGAVVSHARSLWRIEIIKTK